MIAILLAISLSSSIKELRDADLKLAHACYENGMARGRLIETEKFLAQEGARIDAKLSLMIGQPVPRGCDGTSP